MTESEERALVLAARDGDEEAWCRIVRRAHGPLVRWLFARLRDEAASRDPGVGDAERGECLRRTWFAPGGRGAAAEWFFAPDGRCVLMRRYNGPGWDNWEALARSPAIERGGVEYRLWHDTVLWEPAVSPAPAPRRSPGGPA